LSHPAGRQLAHNDLSATDKQLIASCRRTLLLLLLILLLVLGCVADTA